MKRRSPVLLSILLSLAGCSFLPLCSKRTTTQQTRRGRRWEFPAECLTELTAADTGAVRIYFLF